MLSVQFIHLIWWRIFRHIARVFEGNIRRAILFRYKVDVFNIYLFKRLASRSIFSCSVSALTFLSNHEFDFNKVGIRIEHFLLSIMIGGRLV